MAWIVFQDAIRRIGNGDINLSASAPEFKISLHGATCSANLETEVSAWSDIGSEILTSAGYESGGIAVVNATYASVSAGEFKFDFDDPIFTASASGLTGIKYAIVRMSASSSTEGYPLCYAALDTSNFNIGAGNTLTVNLAANGAFTFKRG